VRGVVGAHCPARIYLAVPNLAANRTTSPWVTYRPSTPKPWWNGAGGKTLPPEVMQQIITKTDGFRCL